MDRLDRSPVKPGKYDFPTITPTPSVKKQHAQRENTLYGEVAASSGKQSTFQQSSIYDHRESGNYVYGVSERGSAITTASAGIDIDDRSGPSNTLSVIGS